LYWLSVSFFVFFLSTAFCSKAERIQLIAEDKVYWDSSKVFRLNEIEVLGSRMKNFSVGSKFHVLDSSLLNKFSSRNLADILAQNNYIFIKSYSPGNLSTPSFRGTSASQTAVLWNGFTLQSQMNGNTDFSLLPTGIFNQVSLQFGGGSALFGSGAIGGTLHLDNQAEFDTISKIENRFSVGSFQNYTENINLKIGTKAWTSQLKLFYNSNQNNFDFKKDGDLHTIYQQNNASIEQKNLLSENHFKIKNNQSLSIHYWLQDSYRQIPPTLEEGSTNHFQQDRSHRLTAQWTKKHIRNELKIRAAVFSEQIIFTRPNTDTSNNIAYTFIGEAENNFRITSKQSLNIGVHFTHNQANGNNLPTKPTLNRSAIFAAYRYKMDKKWVLSLSARQQFTELSWVKPVLSAGLEGNYFENLLTIKTSGSTNYRLPTFNDLYWKSGLTTGNADLKPETSYSIDFGVSLQNKLRNQQNLVQWQVGSSFYHSMINHLIYWHTNASQILSVDNIQTVWSRGMETQAKISFQHKKINAFVVFNFDYTLSTIQKTDAKNAATLGKQMIYVPYNKWFTQIGFTYKDFRAEYQHSYTGFRFSTEDNAQFVPAYTIGNVYFAYQKQLKKMGLQSFVKLNNCWNANYKVMQSRPMPLRNFETGVAISYSFY
jgi:vitamin B12 transporter